MPRTIKKDPRKNKAIQEAFLKQLEETGNITASAKKAKVPRRTVYGWLKLDKAFKKLYDESIVIAIEVLEDEAQRRAVHGVEKPVYQGGKLVGYIKEYSDALLIFLLKGKKPEVYKERLEHSGEIKQKVKIGYGKQPD